MSAKFSALSKFQAGFTLIELAIVLFIVTILLAAVVPTLSSQMEQKNRNETRKKLEEVKEALIGYAVVNGRLPCPASATSNGVEDPTNAATGVACTHPNDGFVPAATLGLSGLDAQGYIVDGWSNRIRYAVTAANARAFTTSNGMSSTGMTLLSPDLLVCSTASASGTTCSVANSSLTSGGVPAVIYSTGANGGSGGTSADEAENPNPNSADNDKVFVSHDITGDFDDMVIWLSPNTLFNRMVAAGKLP